MIYKCIQIVKNKVDGNYQWEVKFKLDGTDREDKECVPNPMGHFWYPTTMSDSGAFDTLVICMINAHNAEIEKLETSLISLIGLTL